MCGRYYVDDEMARELQHVLSSVEAGLRLQKQDVLPSQKAIVLAERCRDIKAEPMFWGFPKYNSKRFIINARSETALERGMFRDSLLRRRCVIPAGGFYEWGRSHEKAVFHSCSAPVLYMAGFYNVYGNEYRYVILTTAANESVAPVHDRMPVILQETEIRDWVFEEEFMRKALARTPAPLAREQEYEQQTMQFGI